MDEVNVYLFEVRRKDYRYEWTHIDSFDSWLEAQARRLCSRWLVSRNHKTRVRKV